MKLRFVIYLVIYLAVLSFLYLPNSTSVDIIEEEGFVNEYFCKEVDCAYLLNEFLSSFDNTYCAFYDLDEGIIKETTNAKIFEENYAGWMSDYAVVGSKGLMHNKFCVGEDYVLTGSYNPTERGTYDNDNYVLIIKSKSVAENYLLAYESLEHEQTAKPLIVNLSGVFVENYFCPAHSCESEIISELNDVNDSVFVLAFSFTSKPIADKLVTLHENGVNVSVLFEKTRISDYSQYDYLLENNILVYLDKNKYTMHEKVFVIDNRTVILGSYNPTAAANEKNDENLLIIHSESLASSFVDEFYKLR